MSNNEAAKLFQTAMAARVIGQRYVEDDSGWSFELVLRDRRGHIVLQMGDRPEAHWQSTIPQSEARMVIEPEVADTADRHRGGTTAEERAQSCHIGFDLGSKEQTHVSITWPANATAEQRRAILEQALAVATVGDTADGYIAEAKADLQVQPGQPGAPRDLLYAQPQPEWPGPDWSQAPEWAMYWSKDGDQKSAVWWRHQPSPDPRGYWLLQFAGKSFGFDYVQAPAFGFTGHWRDSLRKRPEVVS